MGKTYTVENVISEIERTTDYVFIYNEDVVSTLKKEAKVDMNNQSLDEILNQLIKGTDLGYSLSSKQVTLYKDESKKVYAQVTTSSPMDVQQPSGKTITGRVTDTYEEPLPGVTVVIKGTTKGTTTDVDGSFILTDVPENATLQFSFVGMRSQEVVVGNQVKINIVLLEDIGSLEELVVVGYGTQKKLSLTSSISTVKSEDLQNLPSVNISSSLQGKVAGAVITQPSGIPGGDQSEILIRGISTLGNNSPLIIVDGVPRDFNKLDVNSIESISILKDAAAVSPYGMAGANGVILVTTKKGKAGKPTLSYNGYYGIQTPAWLPRTANSYDYASYRNIAYENAGIPKIYTDEDLAQYKKAVEIGMSDNPDRWANSNAFDYIFQNSPITNHNISVNGGSDNVNFYIGLDYIYQKGGYDALKNEKYNLISNIEAQVTKTTKFSVGLNGSLEYTDSQHDVGTITQWGIYETAWAYEPATPITFSNGLPSGTIYRNRGLESVLTNGYKNNIRTMLYTQISLEQDIPFIEGLKLKGLFGYDPTFQWYKLKSEPYATWYKYKHETGDYLPQEDSSLPALRREDQKWNNYTYQAIMDYRRTFGLHDVGLLGVFEYRHGDWNSLIAERRNYLLPIDEINQGSGNVADQVTGGTSSQYKQVGYVYKASYGYKGRYMLEASGRYDGHYYFAKDSRFGFFPAFSGAWRISEEDFFKNHLSNLDNLKLRASWGQSGNLAGSPFQYLSTFGIQSIAYIFGGSPVMGFSESTQANPLITWERQSQTDIGFDLGLWQGKLNFEFDYFYMNRDNMLVTPDIITPEEYGIGIAQTNSAKMHTSGVDLNVSGLFKISNDINASYFGNFTYAKNIVDEIFEASSTYDVPNRRRTGRAFSTQFGLIAERLYQEEDFIKEGDSWTLKPGLPVPSFGPVQPGDIKYKDLNGPDGVPDGIIDWTYDEGVMGPPSRPEINYGFGGAFTYKGFDIIATFNGTARSSITAQADLIYPFAHGANQVLEVIAKDSWSSENTNARYPRPYGAGQNNHNQQRSSWYNYNGSFLRLRNLQLGYNFPRHIIGSIEAVRIYLNGTNLFTIAGEVLDVTYPEMTVSRGGTYDEANARGYFYPQQAVYSIGANITF